MFVEKNGQSTSVGITRARPTVPITPIALGLNSGYPTSGAAQLVTAGMRFHSGFVFHLPTPRLVCFAKGQYNVQFFRGTDNRRNRGLYHIPVGVYMEAGIENHSTAMWSRFRDIAQQLGADITVADEAPSPLRQAEEE